MTLSRGFPRPAGPDGAVEDFLSSAEVEELLDAIASAVEQTGKQRVAGEGRRDLVDEVNYNKVFLQRLNLWKINDTVKRYFLDPELGRNPLQR